jgi:hypothetical protein
VALLLRRRRSRKKFWSLWFGKTTMARAYYSVQEEKKSQFIVTRWERKKNVNS